MLSQGAFTFLLDSVISKMAVRHKRFNKSKGMEEKIFQWLTECSGRASWRRAGGDTVRWQSNFANTV